MLQVGLERLVQDGSMDFPGQRIGYLSNQASTTRDFTHGRLLLQRKYGERLCCLFSPQHGFFSEKQDNMIESDHSADTATGLPIFSLYGDHRRPTEEMFQQLDILLVDLVDVGTRVYTFLYTMGYCLEVAAQLGKKVVVLDRPNPLGGESIEGNLLRSEWQSFVGLYPLPMRHGLTFGELALLINTECGIGANLQVVSMDGWRRSMLFQDTGFPWVCPSPNMPTPETALVYPGQVIWEGTNVSEGRGTTKPFEFVGAPYWQQDELAELVAKTELPGCILRPVVFEPTSGKWQGEGCHGFQIHVTDGNIFMPYRTSLTLLQATLQLYPEAFRYKDPPYEYEYERLPMDLILGDQNVRIMIEEGRSMVQLEESWREELATFDRIREKFFLYEPG